MAAAAEAAQSNSNNPTQQSTQQAAIQGSISSQDSSKVNEAYDKIKSIAALNEYKSKTNTKAANVSEKEEYKFTLTFNAPISEEIVKNRLDSNGITPSIIYARAIDQDGNKVTLGQFRSTDSCYFKKASEKNIYDFKGIIQNEGEATGAQLRELQQDKNVFAVEVADETREHAPMGLYWKLENLSQ